MKVNVARSPEAAEAGGVADAGADAGAGDAGCPDGAAGWLSSGNGVVGLAEALGANGEGVKGLGCGDPAWAPEIAGRAVAEAGALAGDLAGGV